MIIDADTHYFPWYALIQNVANSEYHARIKSLWNPMDLNSVWEECYNAVKTSSWPACGTIAEFNQLPLFIRQELKDRNFTLIHISDDLNSIHVDHLDNRCPTIQDFALSQKYFIKTDRQLLNPGGGYRMDYNIESSLAVDIMQQYNRGILSVCQDYLNYDATGWIALQNIEASLIELDFLIEQGFFGAYISDSMPWGFIKQLWPIFERAAKCNFPIYLHTTDTIDPPLVWSWDYKNANYLKQKTTFYKEIPNQFGGRWRATLAGIITEGLFDSFPNLRIVVTEKGLDWIPTFRNLMIENGWGDPLPVFQKNFWFTIEHEEPNFLKNSSMLGWDRLLFATDYPHNDPGGNNRYHDVDLINNFLEQGKITQQDYDLLTHLNYQKLKNRT